MKLYTWNPTLCSCRVYKRINWWINRTKEPTIWHDSHSKTFLTCSFCLYLPGRFGDFCVTSLSAVTFCRWHWWISWTVNRRKCFNSHWSRWPRPVQCTSQVHWKGLTVTWSYWLQTALAFFYAMCAVTKILFKTFEQFGKHQISFSLSETGDKR